MLKYLLKKQRLNFTGGWVTKQPHILQAEIEDVDSEDASNSDADLETDAPHEAESFLSLSAPLQTDTVHDMLNTIVREEDLIKKEEEDIKITLYNSDGEPESDSDGESESDCDPDPESDLNISD